jgi:hypothetical protein
MTESGALITSPECLLAISQVEPGHELKKMMILSGVGVRVLLEYQKLEGCFMVNRARLIVQCEGSVPSSCKHSKFANTGACNDDDPPFIVLTETKFNIQNCLCKLGCDILA